MDQLQSQVLSYEKEVENLSLVDRDKAKKLEHLKKENQQLRMSRSQQQQNSMKELEEQKRFVQVLQARKNEADEEKRKLKEKNNGLLRLLSQVSSQTQTSVPASELGDLLFGNPYYAPGINLLAEAADIASLRKCPMCNGVFPEDTETNQYETHVHSHLLECPFCS
ncbi:calcium-binding and coiled-coil domain-containing protein 2 [Athene cunicularia]|uniref:calcium-binding and coiled-coil domain-containing protein 2 n=1 Tax=Athene cunicularia TaxID=194338 RepID=UPI000EF7222A|nr:calcium-binding and coiled-coil domain-containing protein 2 [Athene cunicularia]